MSDFIKTQKLKLKLKIVKYLHINSKCGFSESVYANQ